MRQDQYERLSTLSEKLADVVLTDADPDGWVGNGKLPKELTQQERGDAYWCRKMAVATLSVLNRVAMLTRIVQEQSRDGVGAAVVVEEESLLDAEINAAEKEASKLLDKLYQRQRKTEFDKRIVGKVHGKP